MEEVYNKEHFYSYMVYDKLQMLVYEKPLTPKYLQPVEDFLFSGKELNSFSSELFSYQEARKCVLDFEIYTLSLNYEKYPLVVDLLMDCYRMAAKEGVIEAYNNIGVFYVMTERLEKAGNAGDIETLTQRYWENMLSRIIMVGHAPKELVDLIGYNPIIEIDKENDKEQIIDI